MFLGRVVEPGEPLWLEDDTESALAWMQYLGTLCSGCGHPATETMNEADDGAWEAVPVHCFACAARDAEKRQVQQAAAGGGMSESSFDGLMIGVQRREGA